MCSGIADMYWLNTSVNICGYGAGTDNKGLIIPVDGGNYTISTTIVQSVRYRVACLNTLPVSSVVVPADRGVNKDNTNDTIIIDTTGYKYLIINATDLTSIQIEKGSTAHDFEPHAEQNAPLTLGNIEAYEGDEIQIDYVQKAGYKKVTGARFVKDMGKYVFTGNENFSNPNTNQYNISGLPISFYTAINVAIGFSNLLKTIPTKQTDGEFYTYVTNNNLDNVLNFHQNGNAIRAYITTCTTLQEFKNMISQLGFYIVYKLATPITTEITDPILLAQLEKIINLKTYKQITNIELTGEDLAPVLDCGYYQDMSTVKSDITSIKARLDLLEE